MANCVELSWGLTPCTKYEHVHSLYMGSGPKKIFSTHGFLLLSPYILSERKKHSAEFNIGG